MKGKKILLCLLFAALMVAGAYIKTMIPMDVWNVTFSLQIFFALLAGFILGWGWGTLSVIIYIAAGLLGLPVFAHGGGAAYIMKPTFGFLIGFAAAAFFTGLFDKKLKGDGYLHFLLAAFLGEMAYYLCGLIYYFLMYNLVVGKESGVTIPELIQVWFLSTIAADFLLCVIASLIAMKIRDIFKRPQS